MKSDAATVAEYLAELPEDRLKAIRAMRRVIRANLPAGFAEGMQFGMIGWYVPLARLRDTYNGQPLGLAALANQKRHMALYLMGIYADPAEASWFRKAWTATGKPLDMGKSCVRFRSVDDVPLDVVGQAIARTSVDDLVAAHDAAHD